MTSLDPEIREAFDLIALLLVFVLGYFAAFFPQADGLIGQDLPSGASQADRGYLLRRLRSYRRLVAGTAALVVLVLAVLTPLTARVAQQWSWTYSAPRFGLLVVDVMLVAMLGVNGWLLSRLGNRIKDFQS